MEAMEAANVEKMTCVKEYDQQKAQDLFFRIQQTLLYSQNPSFSAEQISYLEDILANNLLSIVMHSRNGRECSQCFGVVDRVLDHIRNLRG